MAVLVNSETKVICQGFTGAQGTFHSSRRWRTAQDGRRRDARRAATTHLDLPVFDTVAEGGRQDRRRRLGHLRAAAFRG